MRGLDGCESARVEVGAVRWLGDIGVLGPVVRGDRCVAEVARRRPDRQRRRDGRQLWDWGHVNRERVGSVAWAQKRPVERR